MPGSEACGALGCDTDPVPSITRLQIRDAIAETLWLHMSANDLAWLSVFASVQQDAARAY